MENIRREKVKEVAIKVKENNGRAFLVGGYVRDKLLNINNDDYDIEVYGIEKEELAKILESVGTTIYVGASFGVFKLVDYDIDIALPRTEKKTGEKHTDFKVDVNPNLNFKESSRRRDFTINAMLEDILTGEIIDEYNGKEDLKNTILRIVDERTFIEDPLRVLRGAQFAARFNFEIEEKTLLLCSTMDLKTISKERIYYELKKALLKASKPSIFFDSLKKMNQLSYWFKEIAKMIGINQNPLYHPEGDVYTHTMCVLDNGAKLKKDAKEPLSFMLACLAHDFGKIVTTAIDEKGVIHSYRHEVEGESLISDFANRIRLSKEETNYIQNMAREHMRPLKIAIAKSKIKKTNELFYDSICPNDLILLAMADSMRYEEREYKEYFSFLFERYEVYKEMMSRPYVTGDDLLNNGITNGLIIKAGLNYATKLRLAGIEKNNALKQTLNYLKTI